ncbi:MAG TPA: beta-galactosidase trimerization domain-containing protein, partial [Armatimonadota bacterium]
GETGPGNDSYYGARDRNEYSRKDFVHYLRDLRKLSLDEVSRRWFGAPGKFANWDEVQFPRERNFYGWKDGVSQDLAGMWRMRMVDRETGEKEQMYQPAYDDARWYAYQQPGAEYLASMGRVGRKRGAWLRSTFSPDPALLAAHGALYLNVCSFNNAQWADPVSVYLNGKKLADVSFGYAMEWKQFAVRDQLKKSGNVLAVYAPRGIIAGPVFLTLNKAATSFPCDDPCINAQLYDVREWMADCCARANARYIAYVRGVDPYRPVKLMAFYSMIDVMTPYLEQWGGYPHCTGESAFYRPWMKRYGYIRGVPDSSEPSAPAKDLADFEKLFFTMTMEGMNAHDYFWDLQNILDLPPVLAYYEKNLPYFELMGRYDLKKPDIAIARSTRVSRVTNEDTEHWNDPGRGDLQQSHFSNVYCSEIDLKDRLLDNYKVIIDDNFNTLNLEDVDHLEAYVRQGGTLVLNQRSGRNTYLQREAWPINRLTGCTPTIRPEGGTVTFEQHPPILKAYAGKSFDNTGRAVDWQKHDYYTDSIALSPVDKNVQVIARYQDGQPAIVRRPLGNGWVVVLGSAFYRNAEDISGYFVGSHEQTIFFKALFSDLGAKPVMESDADFLWGERFISNSGASEMLIMGNKGGEKADVSLKDVSATWTLDFTPRRVYDPATGQDLPVKIAGNTVTIEHLDLRPYEMRYFAVERPDRDGLGMVQHWLFRQGQLWKGVPPGLEAGKPSTSWPIPLLGHYQVKQFDNEADARKALAPDSPTDESWQNLPIGDWASYGLRTGKNIWGVYHKTFTIDPAWLRNLRGVEALWQPWQMGACPQELYINGLQIFKNNQPMNESQLLGVLKPGTNTFTMICQGRNLDGNGGLFNPVSLRGIPCANGTVVDISKGWNIYTSDSDSYRADFPAKATSILARKSVFIPNSYKNCSVWVEVKSTDPNQVTTVATNGFLRFIGVRAGDAYWRGAFLMNITPDVKFGEENDLVIGQGRDFSVGLPTRPVSYEYAHLIFVPKGD